MADAPLLFETAEVPAFWALLVAEDFVFRLVLLAVALEAEDCCCCSLDGPPGGPPMLTCGAGALFGGTGADVIPTSLLTENGLLAETLWRCLLLEVELISAEGVTLLEPPVR